MKRQTLPDKIHAINWVLNRFGETANAQADKFDIKRLNQLVEHYCGEELSHVAFINDDEDTLGILLEWETDGPVADLPQKALWQALAPTGCTFDLCESSDRRPTFDDVAAFYAHIPEYLCTRSFVLEQVALLYAFTGHPSWAENVRKTIDHLATPVANTLGEKP